jgi:plasmid stabilization system protein ParE
LILSFHRDAKRELMEALAWYREHSLQAAIDFDAAIAEAVKRIIDFPVLYSLVHPPFRRARLNQTFPYSIIYRASPERLYILAIAHDRREPHYWRKRQH